MYSSQMFTEYKQKNIYSQTYKKPYNLLNKNLNSTNEILQIM